MLLIAAAIYVAITATTLLALGVAASDRSGDDDAVRLSDIDLVEFYANNADAASINSDRPLREGRPRSSAS